MARSLRRTAVMRKGRALSGGALVLALGLTGCGGGGNDKKGAAPSKPAAGAQVTLQLIAFKPEAVSIPAGSAVTWTNKDTAVHTVTSGSVEQGSGAVTAHSDGVFDAGELAKDKTFSHTFASAGTFTYFCNFHPATMRGQVTVT